MKSNTNDLSKSQSNENDVSGVEKTSRRTFVRKVGKTLLSLTVVGSVATFPKMALACGEGTSDSNCGGWWTTDANCGVSGDRDESCGTWMGSPTTDANCGKSTTGGGTGGPNGTDMDEACSTSVNDENCSIAQIPNNGTAGPDVDESCGKWFVTHNPDQSCGDCDDNHQSDEHCGQQLPRGGIDPDDLCGHQSMIGGTPDAACSATVQDVGCGTHTTHYGGTWTDTDQSCAGPTGPDADRNCAALTNDSTCGDPSNPSTTSPDENCSTTDMDEACSRYDKDESCGVGNTPDEACGKMWIGTWGIGSWHHDPDNNCGKNYKGVIDPDDSESETTCIQGGG